MIEICYCDASVVNIASEKITSESAKCLKAIHVLRAGYCRYSASVSVLH